MQYSRILLAVIMVAAGVYHFVNPQIYVSIMPKYLPWHLALVYMSGVLANLNMALHPELAPQIPSVLLWFRSPLQGVLIWWAWQFK
jgi:uncharacterized membrane protein